MKNDELSSSPHTVEYITLKEYIDIRIRAIEKSIEVANMSMDKRLSTMNEIRDTLNDQAKTFLTKNEYVIFKDRIDEDVRSLRESRAVVEGKASQSSVMWVTILSVVGLLLSLISLLMKL